MRPDPVSPVERLFELLTYADTLARLAAESIAAGDDARLQDVLTARTALVSAIADAWGEAQATRPTPVVLTRMRSAVEAAVRQGDGVQLAGRQARDQIAAELASIDARQHAGHEYQSDRAQGTIDVVL